MICKHQRILLFAATVEHAEMIAAILRLRGVRAAVVTGSVADDSIVLYAVFDPKIVANPKLPAYPGSYRKAHGVLAGIGWDEPAEVRVRRLRDRNDGGLD